MTMKTCTECRREFQFVLGVTNHAGGLCNECVIRAFHMLPFLGTDEEVSEYKKYSEKHGIPVYLDDDSEIRM